MGKVRTKSGWLGDEVGTWVSYDDYKQLEAQLDAVLNAVIRTDWTGSKVSELDTVQAALNGEGK